MTRFRSSVGIGVAMGLLAGGSAWANPTGPTVVNGIVTMHMPNGKTLEITNSPNSIINWAAFGIGKDEVTRFIQQSASSAVLNRVVGADPSVILGQLLSNGRVFVINPNGIVFGKTAVVDTAGLIASTLNITDKDFLEGNLRFEEGASPAGGIQNLGYIKTGPKGQTLLIAPDIENSGIIQADGGQLLLAAGRKVTITSLDLEGITFDVQAPDDTVVNLGKLIANGGAVNVFAGTIKHSGAIQANSLAVDSRGNVVLKATDSVTMAPQSTIDVSSPGDSTQGGRVDVVAAKPAEEDGSTIVFHEGKIDVSGRSGGTVNVSGDRVMANGRIDASGTTSAGGRARVEAGERFVATRDDEIDASSAKGRGGEVALSSGESLFTSGEYRATGGTTGGKVEVLADEVTLAGATVSASGRTGGGDVRVGGGYQGGEGLRASTTTTVNASTRLEADALDSGDGGTVVVWSDGQTKFAGLASVKGGAASGDGGLVEVSGKETLSYNGTAQVTAPKGEAGTLLLDPRNLTVLPGEGGSAQIELLDPNPNANSNFGSNIRQFTNGRMLVIDNLDDFSGTDAGAVYLFDMATGALVSTVVGAAAGDQIGSGGTFTLSGSEVFLLYSPLFNGSGGAITRYDPGLGLNGVIGNANSHTGKPGDAIGNGGINTFTYASFGKYAFGSPNWTNPSTGAAAAGALTFGNFAGGSVGLVTASNSLVGDQLNDRVGSTTSSTFIDANRRLFSHNNWHGNARAHTAVDITAPTTGVVSAANSVTGSTADDFVGSGGIQVRDSSIVFFSPFWDSPTHVNAGAVTVRPLSSITGAVSTANSLYGDQDEDRVGSGGIRFTLGDGFIFSSPNWRGTSGAYTRVTLSAFVAGAVGDANSLVGSTGSLIGSNGERLVGTKLLLLSPAFQDDGDVVGAITVADIGSLTGFVDGSNSLLGSLDGDNVGSGGIRVDLGSGRYVIGSPDWHGVSALTAVDVASFTPGVLGAGNSLVGRAPGDDIGSDGIQVLDFGTGQLAIFSSSWDFDPIDLITDSGAITVTTFANLTGEVDETNSLVGDGDGDRVGNGGIYTFIADGFLTRSANWRDNAGAITYVDTSGPPVTGIIGVGNSIVGGSIDDSIGSAGIEVVDFAENILAIFSPGFDIPDTTDDAGAVTVVRLTDLDGREVDESNSIVGSSDFDRVGNRGLEGYLDGGGFYFRSSEWEDGRGAITVVHDPSSFVADVVDVDNSFVGSNSFDDVGSGGITIVGESMIILSPFWDESSDGPADVGAITVLNLADVTGEVDPLTNSFVGDQEGDFVGLWGLDFVGSRWLVYTPTWHDDAGAFTTFDLDAFTPGVISATNSLVGGAAGDNIGGNFYTEFNGNFIVFSPDWANGASTRAGAITVVPVDDITGTVGAGNSVVGSNTDDRVGSGFFDLTDGTAFFTRNLFWNGERGAVTRIDTGSFTPFTVGAGNSLVGSTAGDRVGSGGLQIIGGRVHVFSTLWDNGAADDAGAVTKGGPGLAAPIGAITSSNSLIGTHSQDRVGSGGQTFLSDGNRVLRSPQWNGFRGGLTWFNPNDGVPVGELGTVNSFVGEFANDRIGSSGVFSLDETTYVINSPNWNSLTGAVTFAPSATGIRGQITSANSLVGGGPGDQVGSSGITTLNNGNRLIRSPNWADGAGTQLGAVTWAPAGTRPTGRVSSSNSLVGSNTGDRVGSGGIFAPFFNTTHVIRSPEWNGGAGAVTVASNATGVTGAVNGVNSLVGVAAGDAIGNILQDLGSDRYLVRSTVASKNGLAAAGRIHILDGATRALTGNLLFGSDPGSDAVLGARAIAAFLSSGGSLILQANNDFIVPFGSDIVAQGGSLTIQAGRSVDLKASIIVEGGVIRIVANEKSGVNLAFRGEGDGNVMLTASTLPVEVRAGTVEVRGQNVMLQGGSSDGAYAAIVGLGDVLVVAKGSGLLSLVAGSGANADAAIVSEFGFVTAEYDTCIGCNTLAFNPLLSPFTETGIYSGGGLNLDIALNALLALGNPADTLGDDEEDEEDEDQELMQCN